MARKDLNLREARAEKRRLIKTGVFKKVKILPRGKSRKVVSGRLTLVKLFEVKGYLDGK